MYVHCARYAPYVDYARMYVCMCVIYITLYMKGVCAIYVVYVVWYVCMYCVVSMSVVYVCMLCVYACNVLCIYVCMYARLCVWYVWHVGMSGRNVMCARYVCYVLYVVLRL